MRLSELDKKRLKPGISLISAQGICGYIIQTLKTTNEDGWEDLEIYINWANGDRSVVDYLHADSILLEIVGCCHVCSFKESGEWCELLDKSFKEIHRADTCPPSICPLHQTDEERAILGLHYKRQYEGLHPEDLKELKKDWVDGNSSDEGKLG
jgi:hypothetical protein